MSITVQCARCKNRYAAPETMVGRRVRCKHCGNVFEIGEGTIAHSASDAAVVSSGSLHGTVSNPSHDQGTQHTSATPGKASHSSEGSPFDVDDVPDTFEEAFRDYVPGSRQNVAYKFSTAALLDRWMPLLSLSAGAICLLILAFSGDSRTPAWVAPMRLVLFAALYVAVVYPLCVASVRLASRQLKFDLPPSPRWRILAAFAFPFAFASLLWVNAENFSGLVTGAVAGLAIGLALTWLLLRLQQEEGPTTLGYAAGGFAGGLALCVGVLLLVNAISLQIAKTFKQPTTLAASPIVPGMPWVSPPPRAKAVQPAETPDASVVDVRSPATEFNATTQPTRAEAAPATPSTVPSAPDAATASVASADPQPDAPRPAAAVASGSHELFPDSTLFGDHSSSPASRPAHPSHPFSPATSPPAVSQSPATPAPVHPPINGEDSFLQGLEEAHSPLVVSVAPVAVSETFAGLSPALSGSPWSLAISSQKLSEQEWNDSLEVWYMGVKSEKRAQRPAFRSESCRDYVISPGGTSTVRLIKFPLLAFEIWANGQNAVSKMISLPNDHGSARPSLLGFLSEDRLLVRWQNPTNYDAVGLEVWDLKTGRTPRPIPLAPHVHSPANWAVSPDGKFYALVIRGDKGSLKPQLAVYTLTGPLTYERLPITGMDPQFATDPAAICFSPDNKRVAAMFEHEGNAVIYNWKLSDRKLTGPLMAPTDAPISTPERPAVLDPKSSVNELTPSVPHQLEWVGGGSALLVRGNTVVDSTSGRLMGELGAKGALGAWVNANTCLLLYRQNNALRLVNVQIKAQESTADSESRDR